MGTEVIKIEHPTIGERGRRSVYLPGIEPGLFFEANQGLTSDIQMDQGSEILYKLVKDSDIFVENFRPNVTKHLGNLC